MIAYDIGDVVQVVSWDVDEATAGTTGFTDADGALADPTTVVVTVQAPDGTQTTPSTTKEAVGRYSATVEPDQAGVWAYRWVGTGAVAAAEEGQFFVREQLVA